jgi:UPF0755 protein
MTRPLLCLVLLLSQSCTTSDGLPASDTVAFAVPAGATLSAVADSLHTFGLISSPRLFRFYAAVSGRSRLVRAGVFDVPRDATIREILELLVSGPPALRPLVIREGSMLVEIARSMENQLGIPAEDVLAAARDDSLRTALDVPAPTLEGYLYPSTYSVRADASARDVVRQMAAEFVRRWRNDWDAKAQAWGLTRFEVVTFASIIEGEVRHPADRAYVSSVYHNRLQRGMRLQADPTVIYALGERRRLFERDYDVSSPYNTYRIHGLPPGPIGSPTTASLEAAVTPAASPFLYFVATADGVHVFSRSYAEHLRAIRRIRSASRRTPVTRNGTGR